MEINLNLIPPYRKEEMETEKCRNIFFWQIATVFIILFSFGVILASFSYVLGIELKSIAEAPVPKNQLENFDELKKYDEEFKEANSQVSILKKMQEEEFFWSNLFLELNDVVPEGISLRSVSTKKKQVLISGLAGSRDNLVTLKSQLESSKCFENINFPLSNFAAKENIEFQSDFYIKDNCLKKK